MHTPHEHGETLSEVIELTLAALERVAPGTRVQDLCVIAEAIIEGANGAGVWSCEQWQEAYDAALEGSPRYAAAHKAWLAARAGRVAA
ncbi:MAG TPA: hypothetical protein DCL48_15665 [Alphaproteobacteria bacterium]|nr:hypothetical protein [Alphaproteobacteria bacterium]